MKNTYFFSLFTFIFLQIPLFSQYQNKSEGEINYRYYEDSLLAYPHPFRFIPAQKKPEALNMFEVMRAIGYPQFPNNVDIIASLDQSFLFKVLVDEEGCYIKHTVIRGHPLVVKIIEPHLSSLRFNPAISNNKPIKFWLVIPFHICFK